ncbi:unnamed protein product [Microthlaspi erraticum]|uniref:Uncharacterized protein n=1 Tax=Microthlaspi erraticum TaxID=1685480 RepID=A0A6D2IPD1_9BRAS|nr:unnamed protein product [Microthlaspi erraticum]
MLKTEKTSKSNKRLKKRKEGTCVAHKRATTTLGFALRQLQHVREPAPQGAVVTWSTHEERQSSGNQTREIPPLPSLNLLDLLFISSRHHFRSREIPT